jgi:hypothetical protein
MDHLETKGTMGSEHEYQVLDTRNQKGYNTVYYTHTVASYKKQELLTFHNHRGSPPVLDFWEYLKKKKLLTYLYTHCLNWGSRNSKQAIFFKLGLIKWLFRWNWVLYEHGYQVLDTKNQKGYNTVYYTHTVASYKKQELLTFHNHRGYAQTIHSKLLVYCFMTYSSKSALTQTIFNIFLLQKMWLLRIFEEEKITYIPKYHIYII